MVGLLVCGSVLVGWVVFLGWFLLLVGLFGGFACGFALLVVVVVVFR